VKVIDFIKVQVERSGDGLIVRLPDELASKCKVSADSPVYFYLSGECLMMQSRRPRKRLSLEEMCSRITDENRHDETDWGPPRGREIW
jgi:antitoxin MazE